VKSMPRICAGGHRRRRRPGDQCAVRRARSAEPDLRGESLRRGRHRQGQTRQGEKTGKAKEADKVVAITGDAKDAAGTALPPPTIQPRGVCAPTAAELAKEAGLSPAELQQLQNLGARRSQLDQRESDLSTQLALLAAAEARSTPRCGR